MRDWPLRQRLDLSPPIYERLCPAHAVGHPDPDSAAWAQRAVLEDSELRWQAEPSDGAYVWVHGCCGCCTQPTSAAQDYDPGVTYYEDDESPERIAEILARPVAHISTPPVDRCAGCMTEHPGPGGPPALIEQRHPDCQVHVGPLRCPEHGGVDALWQCEGAEPHGRVPVEDLMELLYQLLDEHGWAQHYRCGWENDRPPSDGMCGKEWAERESLREIIVEMRVQSSRLTHGLPRQGHGV